MSEDKCEFFSESDCSKSISYWQQGSKLTINLPLDAHYISLKDANRLLAERGIPVVGQIKNIDGGLTKRKYWCATQIQNTGETHQALLINITPIEKPDTAEKIVSDLANYKYDDEVGLRYREFVDRAKKLLGRD